MSVPGFLKPSELTTVQGTIQLGNATANAFLAMRDDAAEQDHVNITIAPPGGGYRTMELTLAMRKDPRKYNVTPGILPSLYSVHLEGEAIDFATGLAWVKKHGHKYGISFPLKGDPNHGVHDGITMAGGGTRIGNELDMKVISTGSRHVLMAFTDYQNLSDRAAEEEGKIWGIHMATDYEFDRAIARADARKTPPSTGGGGSTDLTPVLDAVAGVSEQISGFPAPPTAEAIATAVNTDAAQRLAE